MADQEHPAMEGEGGEEKKEETPSVLEELLADTKDFGSAVFDWTAGLGSVAATTAFIGSQAGGTTIGDIVRNGKDGLIVPGSFVAGQKYVKGDNMTRADIRDELISGSIQTAGVIYPAYTVMNAAQHAIVNAVSATSSAQYATAAGIIGRSIMNVPLYFPLAVLGYHVVDHLVKKRTFKGLYSETLKPNYMTDLKNAYKYLGIPVLLNALLMPPGLQLVGAAAITVAYKILMSKKEEGASLYNLIPKIHVTEYLKAGVSVTGKAVKGIGGIYEAGTQVVKGVFGRLSQLGTSVAQAGEEAAPEPAGGH